MADKRELGLKAIHSARDERQRSKHGRLTGPVWLTAGGAVVVVVLVAWMFSNRSLGAAKEKLLAQQHAAVATVGAEWFPLRDRLEKITMDAAGPYKGDHVDPSAASWDFRSQPGIYLRLRVDDAKSVESLREHARDSLKDAFTGCLLREPNKAQAALVRGERPDSGIMPEQPWNLRQAYQATRVLTDKWADEVKEAGDDLRLRVFEQQYDKAKREEIPLAIDIIKRAQFFLLVLDEDAPEAKEYADGGVVTEEALQQVPHPTRVSIVDLKTGDEKVRLRTTADASFVMAGDRAAVDPEVQAAMRRQVNNCALAQDVWAAIHPNAAPADADAGAADAGR